MIIIDWVLLVLLLIGALKGWHLGAIRQVVSLLAFFIGLMVAKAFYLVLGDTLSPHLSNNTALSNTVAFILIWIAVPIVLGLIGELFSKVLGKLMVLGTTNRLLGAGIGILKYVVILGAFIWVFATTGILSKQTLDSSTLCKPMKAIPETIYTMLVNRNAGEKQ